MLNDLEDLVLSRLRVSAHSDLHLSSCQVENLRGLELVDSHQGLPINTDQLVSNLESKARYKTLTGHHSEYLNSSVQFYRSPGDNRLDEDAQLIQGSL